MLSDLLIWLALAVTAAGTAAVVVPVIAANQTVLATSSNTWSPSSVTVNAGAKVTFKLSGKQLRALKRVKRLRMVVTVTLDAKTFQTKLTLKAPTTT